MQHIDKIFKLHNLLCERRTPIQGKDIERKLECCRATRNRVVGDLRDKLKAPLVYDRGRNGYYYDRDHPDYPYELPGLWFNAHELTALLACQHLLADITPGILQDSIGQLQNRLEKLLTSNPGAAKPELKKIKILNQAERRPDDGLFVTLATALFNGKRLNIAYHARGTDQTSRREVSPQTLVRYRDNWYLDAWCHLRRELRSFAVDRIANADPLTENTETIAAETLKAYFAESYGIFSGSPRYTAILNFTAERARWVADEHWHPKQQSQWLEGGRYQLAIPFSDHRELLMDILKHGAEVEVVEPALLVGLVKEEIARMGEVYRNS